MILATKYKNKLGAVVMLAAFFETFLWLALIANAACYLWTLI